MSLPGAPDLVEPVLGWRVWDVVELDGELRLCSLAFWTIWEPGCATGAVCRRALVDVDAAGAPPHTAPGPGCTCGVYATRTAAQALDYSRGFRLRADAAHRVAGQARLWGEVVEGAGGWRSEHAYPHSLAIPTARRTRLRPGRLPRPKLPVEVIARGLRAYGVPVEIVDCATYGELGAILEPRSPA